MGTPGVKLLLLFLKYPKNPTVCMDFPQIDLKSVINYQVNKRSIRVNTLGSLVFKPA